MRYKHRGILFRVFKNDQKRSSSVCKFISQEGVLCFGSIQGFCLCDETPVAIIETFSSMKDAFEGLHSKNFEDLNFLVTTKPCVFKVYGPKILYAVPVHSIVTKCVHITMNSKPHDFITPIPNSYDHH